MTPALKDARLWMATAALVLAAWLLAPFVLPRPAPPVVTAPPLEIRYVCRKSGEVFTLPLAGESVAHPGTGERSLVPAVFDQRRQRWIPGPPLEVMRQRGLLGPPQ